jgi:hypothetical protein
MAIRGCGGLDLKKMWEVYIYGEVPQCLEVPADTSEAAAAFALDDVINRLEFKPFAKGSDEARKDVPCQPVGAIPPRANKRRSAG